MCDIYVSADPIHYEQRTRSMRIHGVVTSIRLENLCWDILARIASKDQLTTNQLICKLYDEIIARQGHVDNLSSFYSNYHQIVPHRCLQFSLILPELQKISLVLFLNSFLSW